MIDSHTQVIQTLKDCKRVLVTTHVRPDGDALGSTAAFILGLRQRGISARAQLLSHLPTKYSFIFKDNNIEYREFAEQGVPAGEFTIDPATFSLDGFDAFVVIDTGTWSQLPGLKDVVLRFNKPKLVIDHHLTQEDWADVKLVIKTAAAAGEIVAGLLQQWDVSITPEMATALYVAIASDTGWFQFSNTRPDTMRLAATLMEAGVDTDRIYQLLYQNERKERVALQARAMGSLELLVDGRLAVMRISKDDFEQTRANVPDTENLINVPLQIATVEVSILMVEPRQPGPVRISLRSKGQVDVAAFAEQFGGGGHARASGLKLDEPFQSAHDKVVDAMVKKMS